MERNLNLLSESEDILFLEEENIRDLSIYDIYSKDVGEVSCLDADNNKKLLLEVSKIIGRLKELFILAGCDDFMFGKCKMPWIADKIDYCLAHCEDKDVLNCLKEEYDRYLMVSSKIVEGNLRLVINIAGDYRENSLIDFNDIIQYGNMGLMRAVEKYNLEYNTTFTTYARLWIKQTISRNINGIKSTYRLPSHVVYDGYSLMSKKNELDLILGRDSSVCELSEYMGLSVPEIEELKMAFYDSVSLDENLGLIYGDVEMTRGDVVADPRVDVYIDGVYNTSIEELKAELKRRLTDKQYFVICKYFGLDEIEYDMEEIAKFLNVSKQRVFQLKRDAIKRLSLMPSFINRLLY